jgi:protein TonB
MFDQTFVDDAQKAAKPISVFVSTLIQISVLAILLLIPLVYTATLPGAMFKSLLVASRPPITTATPRTPKVQAGRIIRVFSGHSLIAPTAIPKEVSQSSDIAAAPAIALDGALGQNAANISIPGGVLGSIPGPAPMLEEPKSKPVAHAIRLGTGVAEANLINRVMPAYPALAKAARIQGSVEFRATISKEGNIENLQLVHGHPLLVNAARDAVLQWKYRPTLLNGQPVEVLTEIVVNFTLSQ